ncbi:hypothetical protein [Aureimonas ureilytica]|uniref:hypothetical protein n=1 Tax=Aureimonas ureilytica TaxID=401562 RepID=UPI0012DBD7B9|nr:hypothetical protein [Aureimonas ureilytica]
MTDTRNNGGPAVSCDTREDAEQFTRADALAALEADYASDDRDINDPANDYGSAWEDHGCDGAEADEAAFAALAEEDLWRDYEARALTARSPSSKEA